MSSLNRPEVEASAIPVAGQESPPIQFNFDNTYARLPERFYAHVDPTPVSAPRLIKLNVQLARQLNLDPDALQSQSGVEILAGNRIADGSEPIAGAYAGHQFAHFVPQLGDGRAILLGEVVARDGKHYDIQLKGPGRTPFSRGGDGRAAIGPVLREYIVSEAMAALAVPTTRALSAVSTGDRVLRERALPGAVLTRVAASHIRVGTFQYFAARQDVEAIRTLTGYAIARHYPDAKDAKLPYRAFLDGVIARHASLVAQWMSIGFIHGVMNTDNTSVSGETIDYGPCAFMEAYDPSTVFSSIDRQGRYAYGNQPGIALWNLARLAETLIPLLEQETGSEQAGLDSANEALAAFADAYEAGRLSRFRRKLALLTEQEDDAALIGDLLRLMFTHRADFTLTFRRLCDAARGPEGDEGVCTLIADSTAYRAWAVRWRDRMEQEPGPAQEREALMRNTNPIFIPRNHRVETALSAAIDHQDYQPFEELLDVVTHPFAERPEMEQYAAPARPEEAVAQTFCGT
jgi:uncharacterized protein YdiU (UPF0061 family)